MKALSLAFVASLAVAGFAQAQTATTPSTPAPAASSSSSSSHSSSISHDCKKEAHKLCGHAHGSAMHDCIKSQLDLNKFSDACATEYKNAFAAKKPSS